MRESAYCNCCRTTQDGYCCHKCWSEGRSRPQGSEEYSNFNLWNWIFPTALISNWITIRKKHA